jgi:hypothetical protein
MDGVRKEHVQDAHSRSFDNPVDARQVAPTGSPQRPALHDAVDDDPGLVDRRVLVVRGCDDMRLDPAPCKSGGEPRDEV